MHPCLNHHFFERPISRENAVKYDILGNLCNPCISVRMHFFEHHRGSHPRCLLNSIAPVLESLHPYLNHHFFEHHGGRQPPPPPRILYRELNCTPISIITSSNIMGGAAAPPQPPATFFFTGIEMPSYLNHHFLTPSPKFVGDARDVGGTCGGC